MNKKVIGYTAGVYDLFHIGHLNLLKNAKSMCDYLVVGVSTDELASSAKGKKCIIPFEERVDIIKNLQCVDAVVPQQDMNKLEMCQKLNATIMFVGDDWHGTEKWKKLDKEFSEDGRKIIYFPYTKHTSSTKIRSILDKIEI